MGQKILKSFFALIFHKSFLNNVILGKPEILKICFVSFKLKKNKIRGNEVIKCDIKKSGLFRFIKINNGKKDKTNMIK